METVLLVFVCRPDPSKLIAFSVAERTSCKSFPGESICSREEKVRLLRQEWAVSLSATTASTCCPVSWGSDFGTWQKPLSLSSGALREFSLQAPPSQCASDALKNTLILCSSLVLASLAFSTFHSFRFSLHCQKSIAVLPSWFCFALKIVWRRSLYNHTW